MSMRMSMLFLTDSFLSLSVLGQLSEAHWLWFRRSSSGGVGGILVPRIIPPAHFRGRNSTACTHHITEDMFSPPQPNDQDNNHNYQCHNYKSANDPSYNPSSTTTTSWGGTGVGHGGGVSTTYKEEHVTSFVLYTLNCHHMHYSLVGLGVSV